MFNIIDKAAVLVEALPYIQKFHGKILVIKYGGHAMVNQELKEALIKDIILMKLVGMHPVLVHGGGPDITTMLQRLGVESRFVGGQRVTDDQTMEVVEMVLGGKLNKELVALINKNGGKAVGLTGQDANLLRAVPRKGPQGEDLGRVGEVVQVQPELVLNLISQGYIPVIAPIAVDSEGRSYNVNADYVAGQLAGALRADKFILLTDVPGILRNVNDRSSLLSEVTLSQVEELQAEGIIKGGMLPKVECCAAAIRAGVERAHIIDGRIPHGILLEIFTDGGIGTMVSA